MENKLKAQMSRARKNAKDPAKKTMINKKRARRTYRHNILYNFGRVERKKMRRDF